MKFVHVVMLVEEVADVTLELYAFDLGNFVTPNEDGSVTMTPVDPWLVCLAAAGPVEPSDGKI